MRFNHMGFTGFRSSRFDYIGINGALSQPLHIRQFGSFFIKYFDKLTTDDFTFGFRIIFTSQCREKTIFSIDTNHTNAHVFSKHRHHLITFVFTQQAIIYKHTNQLIANCTVQ